MIRVRWPLSHAGINIVQYNLTERRLLQNLAWGRESQVRTLLPNFTVVALKCGSTAPKIAKIGIFLV